MKEKENGSHKLLSNRLSKTRLTNIVIAAVMLGGLPFVCMLLVAGSKGADDVYDIGIGIADITGPAADINMMGYAKVSQVTRGIHTRQFSRAFVVSDNSSRVAIVSIDSGMVSHIVKIEGDMNQQLLFALVLNKLLVM
ncbi:neutral ceramidase 3 [Nephila pilipes]|uniref:Neutral ceramidase n=1 Tax=Nephila pilipes TaxID=299642 RepID=A0A8X6IL03_NEPPI|nr:neutral ceramidase 3 [Nephila pilipes]